jgi:hypothetical protein
MTDHPESPEHEDQSARQLRLLSIAIDGVIAQACKRHYNADTQEHQLSSRLAEVLERQLDGLTINGMRVRVNVQELSDRGRGAKEKDVGADLYVSIVVEDGEETVSKGMLVQSKWDSIDASDGHFRGQCDEMRRRSRESYVWVYGPDGVSAFPANAEAFAAAETGYPGRTVGTLLADGVACSAGDRQIGRDPSKPLVESLNAQLRELAVGTALSIVATQP